LRKKGGSDYAGATHCAPKGLVLGERWQDFNQQKSLFFLKKKREAHKEKESPEGRPEIGGDHSTGGPGGGGEKVLAVLVNQGPVLVARKNPGDS